MGLKEDIQHNMETPFISSINPIIEKYNLKSINGKIKTNVIVIENIRVRKYLFFITNINNGYRMSKTYFGGITFKNCILIFDERDTALINFYGNNRWEDCRIIK